MKLTKTERTSHDLQRAARAWFGSSRKDGPSFDRLCDALRAWLEQRESDMEMGKGE